MVIVTVVVMQEDAVSDVYTERVGGVEQTVKELTAHTV